MVLSAKDLLRRLVQIPSINPAFATSPQQSSGEARLTDFLQEFLEQLPCRWLRQQVHPGRENLVAVFPAGGSSGAKAPVLWEVHQDTVGVAGMTIEPFSAKDSEGRIWGRGACDVKGGMAAMLTALARVHASDTTLQQPIVLALTINEECGFTGVKALARIWDKNLAVAQAEQVSGPLSLAELRTLRPNRAIVAEPTLHDVVVAHKGSVRWRCHVHGKAAHTSRPEKGVNAISAMVRVIAAIEKYQDEVLNPYAEHPLCGKPTVCVSTIQGGSGVNTVPDHAVIDIDRRLTPDENSAAAYKELTDFIAAANDGSPATIEHESPAYPSVGLNDTSNRPWAEQIAATAGQGSRLVGVPYGTDAWALDAIGIPTVVFGPGSIDQAHTADEWIAIEQLEHATEIFYNLAVGES